MQRPRVQNRRGSILILTLFLLIVLQFLGMAFLTRVQGEMAETTRDVSSYYVVQSGLADTRQWLQQKANGNVLDTAILALPSGTDSSQPPTMQTYYERTSTAGNVPAGWSWRVRLFPDPYTSGNTALVGNNSAHCYRVVIDAIDTHSQTNQAVRRRATAWLFQGSFAQFSYFFGQFATGSDLWLDLSTFRVEGPFHTNGKLRLSAPWTADADWESLGPGNDGSTAPFQSQATFATTYSTNPDQIEWHNSNRPYDSTTGLPINLSISGKTRYDRISKLGRAGMSVDNPINMPAVSDLMANAAWGDTPPTSPPSGINVNPGPVAGTLSAGGTSVSINKNTSGFYLTGGNWDIIQMQSGNDAQFPIDVASLRGSGNDNASFLMRQGGVQRRLTQTYSNTVLNPGGSWTVNGVSVTGSMTVPAGYTIIQNNTATKSYTVMKDYGNGLFYATDNIKGLEGMNKGRHTIAVDQLNNKEIYITDELLRADTAQGSRPAVGDTRDQLGVVAYAIRFPTSRTSPSGVVTTINRNVWPVSDPMYLYAALFAGRPGDPNTNSDTIGGGVGTISYNSSTYGNGSFRVFGSLTENVRQAKGTFGSGGGTGMSYKYDYDTNFQNVQPPYFPAQSNFDVRSWNDAPINQDA